MEDGTSYIFRERTENGERESKIHMHDNVRSIHPEVGKVGRYLVD